MTSYELLRDRIPVTLIVDGAAGYVIKTGKVNAVIVGWMPKEAPTVRGLVKVTVQLPCPVQAPVQLSKVAEVPGDAVRLTVVPGR